MIQSLKCPTLSLPSKWINMLGSNTPSLHLLTLVSLGLFFFSTLFFFAVLLINFLYDTLFLSYIAFWVSLFKYLFADSIYLFLFISFQLILNPSLNYWAISAIFFLLLKGFCLLFQEILSLSALSSVLYYPNPSIQLSDISFLFESSSNKYPFSSSTYQVMNFSFVFLCTLINIVYINSKKYLIS